MSKFSNSKIVNIVWCSKKIIIQSVKRISVLNAMKLHLALQPLYYKQVVSSEKFWFQTKFKTSLMKCVSKKSGIVMTLRKKPTHAMYVVVGHLPLAPDLLYLK